MMIMIVPLTAIADAKLVRKLRNQSVAVLAPSESGTMSGSGVILKGHSHTYFLTCYHVIEGSVSENPQYNVTVFQDEFRDGILIHRHSTTAKVVRYSPRGAGNDIAILESKDSRFGLDTARLHVGAIPEAGTDIYHVGYLKGKYPLSVTKGIVSYVARPINGGRRDHLDITLYPGSSGGPVFDTNGSYIGMLSDGEDNRIGFMIPIRQILEFLSKEMPELLP